MLIVDAKLTGGHVHDLMGDVINHDGEVDNGRLLRRVLYGVITKDGFRKTSNSKVVIFERYAEISVIAPSWEIYKIKKAVDGRIKRVQLVDRYYLETMGFCRFISDKYMACWCLPGGVTHGS